MRDLSTALFLLLLLLFSIYNKVGKTPKAKEQEAPLPPPIVTKPIPKPLPRDRYAPRVGSMQILSSRDARLRMRTFDINSLSRQGAIYFMPPSVLQPGSDRYEHAYFCAPSTKNVTHAANAYLVNFVPSKEHNVWEALGYLRQRISYQLDEKQFNGREEVWQTSYEAYHSLRGDCEDHALLLADWLIGQGYDARVVIGVVRQGLKKVGHAWVVLFDEGQEYLLEATSKYKWNQLPLSKQFNDYYPSHMFNRDFFWQNVGPLHTTRYHGKHWEKRSRFISK